MIVNLNATVRQNESKISELTGILSQKERELEEVHEAIRKKNADISRLDGVLREREATLNRIYDSHGWKALLVYYKVRNEFLPPNSRRVRAAKIVWNFVWKIFRTNRTTRNKALHENEYATSPQVEQLPMQQKIPLAEDVETTKKAGVDNLEPLEFPVFDKAKVSIIIPVWDQRENTYNCLRALLENTDNIPYKVLAVDNSSTDEMHEMLAKTKNVNVITNNANIDFISLKAAQGKYVVILDTDAQVTQGWLDSMVELAEKDESIGLVGPKLISPNGNLQEAGGIIWKDASVWHYGGNDDPEKPEYNYVKEADYISSSSIMIRKDLWRKIGGFDKKYEQGYLEDIHLAFEVRRHGYKVVYQPKSVVVRFEGISHEIDLNNEVETCQNKNRERFIEKWRNLLNKEHFEKGQDVFHARDRSRDKKTILVIDHYVPHYDQDAGSRNTFHYLQLFLELGLNVKFLGDNFFKHEPYTTELEQMGIEVLYGDWYRDNWQQWIKKNGKYINYIYLNRPNISLKYLNYLKKYTNAKLLYYGHDLIYLRHLRRYEVQKNEEFLTSSENWKKIEFEVFKKVDVIFTLSTIEDELMQKNFPNKKIFIIPCFIYDKFSHKINNFEKRKNMMFVGGFAHPPNVDGILWYSEKIFPRILEKLPNIKFYIVGSNPGEQILNLASSNVVVTGYLTDDELVKLYNEVKLIVIPLRYGAGVKGKTVEAMYHGVPIVTTSAGIEGLQNIEEIIEPHDSEEDFATEVLNIYNDNEKLQKISQSYVEYVKRFCSKQHASNLIRTVLEVK
ncbi:MAG: glycosyltransferase [Candidatus Hodarchaeota archaeon]